MDQPNTGEGYDSWRTTDRRSTMMQEISSFKNSTNEGDRVQEEGSQKP